MTEEQKNIVLLGSRYETMNKYIDLSNDDGTIAKGIAEAMQEYAERYHIVQTKKLHQPIVIGSPIQLEPVLAEIEHLNDLGKSTWYEVVYYDDKWYSYSGSKTFEDGEKVIKWKYVKDCL